MGNQLMHFVLLKFIAIFFIANKVISEFECKKKDFGHGSPVCICDELYCDKVKPIPEITSDQVVIYLSSKSGDRLEQSVVHFSNKIKTELDDLLITIDLNIRKQSIIGFGGAFTDSTGMNIAQLSEKVQNDLMDSYFSQDGIEYNIGRVPIASCDFSSRVYSYDDVDGDFELQNFTLTEEDFHYKVLQYNALQIPFIKIAQTKTSNKLKLFGSPWSAPAWMKTNKNMAGKGTIIGKPGNNYYETWAKYFVRFLEEYKKQDIDFWALTMQNEPTTGFIANYPYQTTGFTPAMQRDFLKINLGPTLRQSAFNNTKIMILDDNRLLLPFWADVILRDPDAQQYVSYIAVHWYSDRYTPACKLNITHVHFPDFPLIGTEACNGFAFWQTRGPILGSWYRAQQYAHSIIEDLNNHFTGWVDWNLALDMDGGPNWANNTVDSPVIVDKENNAFYKQPMFYILGHFSLMNRLATDDELIIIILLIYHFSKFFTPDSVVLHTEVQKRYAMETGVEATAALRADGIVTLVLHNSMMKSVPVKIVQRNDTRSLRLDLPPHSIQTILWLGAEKIITNV
ncbi:putative glucosylceramidase 3 [Trichinella pseudospiralis]|uniref:Glucosylceramidase n=1 Tax=Trichinella pseudospiralis TaxID=6337 RepID=A0A0V1E1U3_TRIPS|nr:putative glucosylceramidase 3 [Trichinella pseudospiralis]KRY67574.1 putative glucosylceramidase 3 [Trichinella pseudospiralis]KRZ23559.1 putative glucosylceramidase 3 [Trichinella pseudospiralis]